MNTPTWSRRVSSIRPKSRARRCKTPRQSRACCSPPKHWSRRFLRRKKLLRCLQAEWAAWIIETVSGETPKNFGANRQPKQQLTNSRARKGSAVLFSRAANRRRKTDVQDCRVTGDECLL